MEETQGKRKFVERIPNWAWFVVYTICAVVSLSDMSIDFADIYRTPASAVPPGLLAYVTLCDRHEDIHNALVVLATWSMMILPARFLLTDRRWFLAAIFVLLLADVAGGFLGSAVQRPFLLATEGIASNLNPAGILRAALEFSGGITFVWLVIGGMYFVVAKWIRGTWTNIWNETREVTA